MWHTVPVTVNGYSYEAHYSDEEYETSLRPLLERLAALHAQAEGRVVAFLAGPPAAGKSTLAVLLEGLARGVDGCDLQVIGLDGFHHYNDYLRSHEAMRNGQRVSLASIKGAPETFDVERFAQKLAELREGGAVLWPVYDRTIHEPREDALTVTAPIVVVEGNWLLLNDRRWADLAHLADLTIFLHADEADVRERAIARKAQGGFSREEAEAHYERTDGPNVRRAIRDSLPADVNLNLL